MLCLNAAAAFWEYERAECARARAMRGVRSIVDVQRA